MKVLKTIWQFCYKCNNFYSKECDRNIRWNDPDINIDWKSLGWNWKSLCFLIRMQ